MAFAQHDAGQDLLTVMAVGHAHRGGVEHRGMAQQRFIDLARGDVLAALDDQLLDAAGDEEEAVGVAVAEVAGAQPAVGGEARGGGVGILVVAAHHVRTADRDLAGDAVGHRLQRGVDHPRFAARGLAHRPELAPRRIERVREAWRHRFGQPHRLDHAKAEFALEALQVLGRQRRRRRPTEADSGQRVERRCLGLEQERHHRRHHVEPAAALVDRPAPVAGNREPRRHHQAAARCQRRQHRHREGVDVVERHHREHPIIGPQSVLGDDGLRVGRQVGLGQHHALGLAGGARGVHQQRQRVGGRLCRPALRRGLALARQHERVGFGDPHRHRPVERGGHLANPRFPFRRHHHQLAVRMAKHVAHLLGLRQQVHRVDAAPAPQHAQQHPQRVQAVGHHHRDRVASGDAGLLQQRRDARAAGGQLAVAQHRIAVCGERKRRVGSAERLAVDQRAHGARGVAGPDGVGGIGHHAVPYLSK